ncbi:MAG: hypothetical protein H6765_06690 [Candidatus Peribacteria bacterium]|nr:MAG: hypothetical protein H6765_06690 [Candidatus Peribacteria bacterium]
MFYNVPARKEFIKSTSTESSYISQIFLNYALVHYDKSRKLLVNNKVKWQVAPAASLMERIQDLFKTEWHEHLNPVAYKDEQLELFGVVSDAALHFSGTQYLYLFVNQRPVQDRLVKKAVIDAYYKQLAPGTYPFVVLFIDIDPSKVDVNVHPRKSEVKFLDPGSMFSLIKETIQKSTGENKVNYAAFTQSPIQQKQFSSGHGYNA